MLLSYPFYLINSCHLSGAISPPVIRHSGSGAITWRVTSKIRLEVPSLDNLDWTMAKEAAAAVDRSEKFVGFMCAGGLFERTQHGHPCTGSCYHAEAV